MTEAYANRNIIPPRADSGKSLNGGSLNRWTDEVKDKVGIHGYAQDRGKRVG